MVSFYGLCFLSASFFAAVYGQKFDFLSWLNQCCPAGQKEPWSYQGLNGPPFWGLNKSYTTCYGYQQSPIFLFREKSVGDENLAKLTLNNYDQAIIAGRIENNGHTVEVIPDDGTSRTISVNGSEYSLRQFHFHWGSDSSKGSEHIVEGKQYAMEMHLVHMNNDNKIAVVGILFYEQETDNDELQKIVDRLSEVKYKGDEAELASEINLNNILPENPASFYRYQGSLTTPPCTQGVTWSVVPNPVKVGKAQMEKFRQLYSVKKEDAQESCKLVNNYRPVQPKLGRQVYISQ